MWVLQNSRTSRSYCLCVGTFAVGRDPTCSIRLENKDTSRKHALIRISIVNGALHCSICDISSTGTFVDESKLANNLETSITRAQHRVLFGSEYFELYWRKVILCFSKVDEQVQLQARTIARANGILLSSSWSPDCTHVIVSSNKPPSTLKVMLALASANFIVKKEWLFQFSVQPAENIIPDESKYVPTGDISYKPDLARHKLFQRFCLLYPIKSDSMSIMEAAGGRPIDLATLPSDGLQRVLQDAKAHHLTVVLVLFDGCNHVESSKHSRLLLRDTKFSRVYEHELMQSILDGHLAGSCRSLYDTAFGLLRNTTVHAPSQQNHSGSDIPIMLRQNPQKNERTPRTPPLSQEASQARFTLSLSQKGSSDDCVAHLHDTYIEQSQKRSVMRAPVSGSTHALGESKMDSMTTKSTKLEQSTSANIENITVCKYEYCTATEAEVTASVASSTSAPNATSGKRVRLSTPEIASPTLTPRSKCWISRNSVRSSHTTIPQDNGDDGKCLSWPKLIVSIDRSMLASDGRTSMVAHVPGKYATTLPSPLRGMEAYYDVSHRQANHTSTIIDFKAFTRRRKYKHADHFRRSVRTRPARSGRKANLLPGQSLLDNEQATAQQQDYLMGVATANRPSRASHQQIHRLLHTSPPVLKTPVAKDTTCTTYQARQSCNMNSVDVLAAAGLRTISTTSDQMTRARLSKSKSKVRLL